MALPVTVSSPFATGGFAGPFKSAAGAYYFFARPNGTQQILRCYKATDPSTSWAAFGSSVTIPNISPSTTGGFHSIDGVQDGDTIHIATVDADVTTTSQTRVHYHKFDMSSETYPLTNELVDGPTATTATSGGDLRSISIVRRSASVVIAYQMPSVLYMSANYARVGYRERTDASGTWGAAVAVDAIGAAATTACFITAVKDPQTNRIHFFWYEAGTTPRIRTLSAANVFNTAASLATASQPTATTIKPYCGAATVVGGVSKVVFARHSPATSSFDTFRFDSADNPTIASRNTTFTEDFNASSNRVFTDDGKFYYLNAGTTSLDLFVSTSTDNGATWSTPTLAMTAAVAIGSTQYLSTNGGTVYIRGSNYVIPYVVNDAGFVKYNEFNVRSAGPVDINVTSAQTLSAVTQSSGITVPRNADASQTTAEAATAGTIQAMEARAVTGAQTTEAVTQSTAVALLAKVTTGTQGTSAVTQTSAVAAGLAVTGAQTLSPVTQSTAVKVGLAVTGAQNTNAATTLADAKAIATGTAAQTLAATTQTSGLTTGPASFAVTGAQTLSPVSQVFTASVGAAFVTVTGSQTLIEATTSAAAKALATVTGSQNTNAVTQSLIADVDLAVTGAQTLSPATTSATAKPLAAVTSTQTTLAASQVATGAVLAKVTTGSQTTNAATTSATATAPPALAVTGAQTLNATTQVFSLSLGAPFLTVTGDQQTSAATTSATATARNVVTASQTLSAVTTAATADVDTQVTGAQTLPAVATAGSIALVPFGAVVVNGAQTTNEAATTGSILLGALPTRIIDGAQTTLACTTAGTIDGGGVPVEPPIELPSGGGGGSRAYRRRLREAREGRRVFEDKRARRIAAISREDERKRDPLTMERAPLKPAPETIAMLNRLLYEPITREIERPQPQEYQDDGGEEELLLLMLAD